MSQQSGGLASAASPSSKGDGTKPLPSVEHVAESDSEPAVEHDSPEEFVDAVSVRSLTKRSVSATKAPPSDDTSKVGSPSAEGEPPEQAEESLATHSARAPSPAASRFSDASNLDNVNLDDEAATKIQDSATSAGKDQPNKTLSLGSITSAFPSMPWSPPAESPSTSPGASTTAIAPPPPSRKLTSPFSWLSRTFPSKEKDNTSPSLAPVSPGKLAVSSSSVLHGNPEMMINRLEAESDAGPDRSNRESLKDRFKALRMREESGILPAQGADGKNGDPPEADSHGEAAPAGGDKVEPRSPLTATHDRLPASDSGLEAGGTSANSDTQVDWDLWQSVVYEGPAAVARTSAAELNKAIATGIPNAIRGVIWQVLAQSKNDELEAVYKELVSRGTEVPKDRHSNSTVASGTSNGNVSSQSGDAVASSASSLHSDQSASNGTVPSKGDKNNVGAAKTQPAVSVASAADRLKKDKENSAAMRKLEKAIRRDLGARTSYFKYAAAAGLQEGLFGVCKAYALHDEGVGYAQGMNFLVMPLLFNMPEQEAFCLLVRLMNHYQLRDLFTQDMPGLHLHLYQFERLLEDIEPALYCHLHRRGISPHLYATQWFLTLFAYRFPLQLVLRIYDLILSEGLSAILRFGIALMQKNAATLLEISDMQQLTTYLKDRLFDVYIDKDPSQGSLLENGFFGSSSSTIDKEVYKADQLVRDACAVMITPELLRTYSVEWEEKTKAEKDREEELLEFRTANQKLAVCVRKLEERVEVCDREQASLATELVHTKVENEELRDENESLKGQVRELKLVIEQQPTEIEESWKLERDDLMRRNEKVHEENQKLEKELAELEEELVQTKLRYAEINSQHETLTRKWSDLKRQFA